MLRNVKILYFLSRNVKIRAMSREKCHKLRSEPTPHFNQPCTAAVQFGGIGLESLLLLFHCSLKFIFVCYPPNSFDFLLLLLFQCCSICLGFLPPWNLFIVVLDFYIPEIFICLIFLPPWNFYLSQIFTSLKFVVAYFYLLEIFFCLRFLPPWNLLSQIFTSLKCVVSIFLPPWNFYLSQIFASLKFLFVSHLPPCSFDILDTLFSAVSICFDIFVFMPLCNSQTTL